MSYSDNLKIIKIKNVFSYKVKYLIYKLNFSNKITHK